MCKLKALVEGINRWANNAMESNKEPSKLSEDLKEASEILEDVAHNLSPIPEAPKCPRCGSKNFILYGKKFSTSRAVVGIIAVGPIGAAAGASNKAKALCKDCGKRWSL